MYASAVLLAFLVPFVFYVPTTSAFGYWLDSGELVAASRNLAIAHPPGEPVTALWGRLFLWFPVGPAPWRIALASGVAASLASALLFAAAERTVARVFGARSWKTLAFGLGAAWLAAFAPGFWMQAVRPEVYAVQVLLEMLVIERIVALEASWPTTDTRPLFVAAIALGLGLANHHFLAFLLLPAVAPTLARVMLERGSRPLVVAAAFVAVGLLTYLYLPLRALAHADPSLGAPTTFSRMAWVVSAEVFQKSSTLTPQPIDERLVDVVVLLFESLGAFVVFASALGAYVLGRTTGLRRLAWTWGTVLVITLVARGWLGFVRSNPDALGYLMPAMSAASVLAAVGLARVSMLVAHRFPSLTKAAPALAASVVLALGLAQASHGLASSDLSAFDATDVFDDLRRRDLPYGAVVIASTPSTSFRHWGGEASERLRPDITLVPIPFLGYPGMVDEILLRDPSLLPLLRGFVLEGTFREGDLQSLASERPVFVELDPVIPVSLYSTLVPAGALYEVLPEGATITDVRASRRALDAANAMIGARLAEQAAERGTFEVLLWKHYNDALFLASVGDREGALASARAGLDIAPETAQLKALVEAIDAAPGRGGIDVAPFLPDAPPR